MSALALCGWVALAFGAGAYSAVGSAGWFSRANLALGTLALLAAALRAALRARGAAAPAFRGPVLRGLLGVALTLAGGVALERVASATRWSFDWSFEHRFELSPATLEGLAALGRVEATFFRDDFDPRARSTRLLLRALEATGHLHLRERPLGEAPDLEDRYGIASSNSVVFQVGKRFETVERPTEGSFYEALYRLRARESGVVYATRGAGEGDLSETSDAGFSGLAVALQTEGFRLREFVTATAAEVPDDADLVLALAPRRPLRPESLAALDRYLAGGGRLVAFLEPGVESGLEALLARFGLASPDALVVDPASGAVVGDAPGLNPLALHYADHPIARGLNAGRMTFFHRARALVPRRPEPEDEVRGVVFASGRSWLASDPSVGAGASAPERPPDAAEALHALVAAGSYRRGGRETRVVAFGDVDLASNHYLRTLYNLDLVLNAVLWATEREPDITIRPKGVVSGRLQLPLPLQNTLTMFQGVGLLLPELLLIAGVVAWSRARDA